MITAVALCPHPPLLFRELTGRLDVAADLRACCVSAVKTLTRTMPDLLVLVGGAGESRTWDPALALDVRAFGTTGTRAPNGLPLSLGVGGRLLESAGWAGPVESVSIAWDSPVDEIARLAEALATRDDRTALLVLGDGSARRGEAAPGHLDERAFDLDTAIGRALGAGDARTLLEIDVELARELMVGGRAAFQLMAAVVDRQETVPEPSVAYQDDPFGVMYHVVTWQLS